MTRLSYDMEQLVNFIVWTFTLLGLTTIVSNSGLLAPVRMRIAKFSQFLGILVGCPMCFAFWAGMFLSYFYQSMTGNMFFDGVLGSGLVWYITYESPQQNPMMTHGPH